MKNQILTQIIRRKRRRDRSGIATLEFVLGFPFLMLIAAIVFVVAYSGVAKTKVVYQSRYEVWKMRDGGASNNLEDFKRIEDTKPMDLFAGVSGEEMPGEISGTANTTFTTYDWLGGEKKATSKTAMIFGTWDHTELTEFTDRPGGPHLDIIGNITGVGAFSSVLGFASDIIGFLL